MPTEPMKRAIRPVRVAVCLILAAVLFGMTLLLHLRYSRIEWGLVGWGLAMVVIGFHTAYFGKD